MRFICPCCGVRAVKYLGERDGYDVFRCDGSNGIGCDKVNGCWYTYRTPMMGHTLSERDKYVGRRYHWNYQETKEVPTFEDRFDHDYNVAKMRLNIIKSYRNPRTDVALVDVGCSNGAFVKAACDEGYNAFGVDLSEDVVSMAKKRTGLTVRFQVGEMLPLYGLTIVTYHDVLEHLIDPYAALRRTADHMMVGGLLVVEAPDPAHPDAVEAGLWAKHTKPYEHTMLLPESGWREMLTAAGYSVKTVMRPVAQKLAIYATRS